MTEISLACSILPWGGSRKFVNAIADVSQIGFEGVECPGDIVDEYEDRLHVFEEMLAASRLRLCAMIQEADLQSKEKADEEVEHAANTARFLGANGSQWLVVSPTNAKDGDLAADDWTTAAAILDEMGERCQEFGVTLVFRPRAGYLGGNERGLDRLLELTDSKLVRLCLDTAEAALSDVPPPLFYKRHSERIVYVRFRDASGAKRKPKSTNGEPGSMPSFGRGSVDFTKVAQLLAATPYSGWVSIDVSGELQAPKDAAEAGFRFLVRKSGLFI